MLVHMSIFVCKNKKNTEFKLNYTSFKYSHLILLETVSCVNFTYSNKKGIAIALVAISNAQSAYLWLL